MAVQEWIMAVQECTMPIQELEPWQYRRVRGGGERGAQANLWTEFVKDEETVEYMLLPRLCALAEAVWTPRAAREWTCFRSRLAAHLPRLDARGFKYHPL